MIESFKRYVRSEGGGTQKSVRKRTERGGSSNTVRMLKYSNTFLLNFRVLEYQVLQNNETTEIRKSSKCLGAGGPLKRVQGGGGPEIDEIKRTYFGNASYTEKPNQCKPYPNQLYLFH